MTRTIRFILNAIRLARKPSRAVESFSQREGEAQSELTGAGGAADGWDGFIHLSEIIDD